MKNAGEVLEQAAETRKVLRYTELSTPVLETTAGFWGDYLNGLGANMDMGLGANMDMLEAYDVAAMMMLYELAKLTKLSDAERGTGIWNDLVQWAGSAWAERLRYEDGEWCTAAREKAKQESEGRGNEI